MKKLIKELEGIYGNMRLTQGKNRDLLGIDLSVTYKVKFKVRIINYLKVLI